MITKPISIPINLLGPGSQPERSVANTIGVPDIVDTFRQPYTPEVANKATAEKCRQFFIDLYEEMRLWNMDSGDAGPAFAMNSYDKDTLALINQMLGEGEVAIRISIPNETFDEIRIQESIFVGVWRVCYYRDGQQIADQLEVSAIPSCVAEAAYVTSQPDLHPSMKKNCYVPTRLPYKCANWNTMQNKIAICQSRSSAQVRSIAVMMMMQRILISLCSVKVWLSQKASPYLI